MERNEDDIITNEPFKLAFGETSYPVKRLPIGRSKAWRRKVLEVTTRSGEEYFKNFGKAAESLEELETRFLHFREVAEDSLDKIVVLVAAYCEGQITQQQIEEGTDEQVMGAFRKLVEVAFPNGMMTAGMAIVLPRLQT